MLACNHTDGVHILLLSCSLSLANSVPDLLTPALLQQQRGALSALRLILRHLCFRLGNHILAGPRHNCITEMQR